MPGTPTKINNLQALRAFAAVAVVFFHTGYVVPNHFAFGEYGVDIFFVLSGYIMARICEKSPQFFLRRRLIRILPPYWTLTILLFCFALAAPHLLQSTRANGIELLKSLFFIPFIKDQGLIRPILFVGWSLNYEMFFYLTLAFSLLVLRKRPILLASGIVLAAHYGALLLPHVGVFSQFLRAGFIIEFPLGALAYHAVRGVSFERARPMRWVSLAVLIVSIGAITYAQIVHPHFSPSLRSYFFSCFATLIVASASLLSQGGWDTRLTWLILIGDASYVLYLSHPYVVYLIGRVIVPHAAGLRTDRLFGSFLAICFSIAVGLLLHLYAERPALAWLNDRFGGHRKSAEFGVVKETRGVVQP